MSIFDTIKNYMAGVNSRMAKPHPNASNLTAPPGLRLPAVPKLDYQPPSVGGITVPNFAADTKMPSPANKQSTFAKLGVPTPSPAVAPSRSGLGQGVGSFLSPATPSLVAPTPSFAPQAIPQVINQPQAAAAPTLPTGPGPVPPNGDIPQTSAAKSPIAAPLTTGGTQSPVGAGGGTQTPISGGTGLSAMQKAEKAVEDANKISADELSTQEEVDKLQESLKTAFRNTGGQTIPLEFITGQKKALEERALGLAEPLTQKLGRLQAARTASLAASKFALERLDKKEEKATPKAPEPFTLSPGEVRYDATGKQIASGGVKPPSEAVQLKAMEAEQVKTLGKSNSLDNYALVNELLSNPALGAISGFQAPTAFLPGTQAATAKNIYNQVKGILSLENRQKLKGSGAISDFESRTLEQAASALGRNLSDAEFKKQLAKIKGAFATAAGLEADVKVTSPNGETIATTASRAELDNLIAEGNKVEYQ